MTDPASQRDHAAREARRFELLQNLQAGQDSEAILGEMAELDAADDEYLGRLMNEVEVDHALRRGATSHQYEAMKAALAAALPAEHPVRRSFERLIDATQNNESLTAEEEAQLQREGVPADMLSDLRASQLERKRLEAERDLLDGNDL